MVLSIYYIWVNALIFLYLCMYFIILYVVGLLNKDCIYYYYYKRVYHGEVMIPSYLATKPEVCDILQV